MNVNWLKARQTKYTAYVTAYIVVILAVLVAANFLGNRYDKSYDSTANKQFSLSDQTVKVVKSLKHAVTFDYFGETPSFPQARDLLDRYSALSPEVHVQYIDPVRKPQIAKAAGSRSDSPVVVNNGTRQEGAKALTEEEVTGALIRSLQSGERDVYVLNAADEHSIDDTDPRGFSDLKAALERDNYKVKTLGLKGTAAPQSGKVEIGQAAPANFEIPKDCSALIIGGPQNDYPPVVVNAIKTYVENGGHVLIMLDETVPIGHAQPAAQNPELIKLLASWGVTVNNDLVLDLSGLGQIFGLGPEVPLLASYDSHPITQPLSRVPTAYPLVRSLDVKNGDKTTVSKLVETTEDSVAVTAVGPGGAIDPRKGKKGPFTVAAAGTYNGPTQGRFIVTGTSMWAQNSVLGSRQLGNSDLLDNMVNWLTSEENLISIRSKGPEDRPLNITAQKLNLVFWLSVVIFPLGVVGFGMATWWKRR